jgi:hypothetical protein
MLQVSLITLAAQLGGTAAAKSINERNRLQEAARKKDKQKAKRDKALDKDGDGIVSDKEHMMALDKDGDGIVSDKEHEEHQKEEERKNGASNFRWVRLLSRAAAEPSRTV